MTNVINSSDEPEAVKVSSTVEDYLSLVYVLERDNEPVVGARLSELLRVTPPTVTNTLKRMVRDGLITMTEAGTHLTPAGWEAGQRVLRRHMLMEWMMVRMLPWSKLHGEAHNLEHAISTMAETALLEDLGHPQVCPHGNPLPGFENAVSSWEPLTEMQSGAHVMIRRVHELAEQNNELLAFLEAKKVMPGQQAEVTETLPFNQTITLRVQGELVTIGYAVARYIFVERLAAD